MDKTGAARMVGVKGFEPPTPALGRSEEIEALLIYKEPV